MTKLSSPTLIDTIDRRYSRALFASISEQEEKNSVAAILNALADCFENYKDFTRSLESPVLSASEKWLKVQSVLGDYLKTSRYLKGFFHLLVEKNRLDRIPSIAVAFQTLCEAEAGVKRITVEAADLLTDGQKTEIEKAVRASFSLPDSTNTFVECSINKEIRGGFVVHFDGKTIDLSLSHKFKNLMAQMGAS